MKFTFLCEDQAKISTYIIGESSLSILIEVDNKKFLFDTGGHTIEHNAELLGINLKDIDGIIISHSHWDHSNGLLQLEKYLPKTTPVYLHPDCFKKTYVAYEKYPEVIANQKERLCVLAVEGQEKPAKYIGMPYTLEEMKEKYSIKLCEASTKISNSVIFLGAIPRLTSFEAKSNLSWQ